MKYLMIICLTFTALIAQAQGQCNIVIRSEVSVKKFVKEFKDLGYQVVGNIHQADFMALIKVDRATGQNWAGVFITDLKTNSEIVRYQSVQPLRTQVISDVLYKIRTYFTPCKSGLIPKNIRINDPLPFLVETQQLVKSEFPHAQLLMISTFTKMTKDNHCSPIGFQFIYQDHTQRLGIRRSLIQIPQADGSCAFGPLTKLSVSDKDYPILGQVSIENKVSEINVSFAEALGKAKSIAGKDFTPFNAKLHTPIHYRTFDKILWSYQGQLKCNKTLNLSINAVSGEIQTQISASDLCPSQKDI